MIQKHITKLILIIAIICLSITDLIAQDQNMLDSLHNELRNVKDKNEECLLYVSIGDVFEHMVPDSAIYYYEKCIDIAEENEYEAEKSLAMGNVGIVYLVQGEVEKAMDNFLKALAIREKLDDKDGMARSYNNIGIIYRSQGNYELAIEYYEKSLAMNIEQQDSTGMSRSFNNIGIVYFDQGNYDKSIEYFLKSLKIREGLGNTKGVADSYANIGLIYHNQGSYESSVEYSLEAQEIYEELEDVRGLSVVYNNLGIFHSDNDKYDEAIEYHQKSLEIKEQIGDLRGISYSYTNIGNVYRKKGEHDKAIAEYIKALKIDEETGDLQGQAIVYTNIAELYTAMAQKSSGKELEDLIAAALEYGHNAYELALRIGALPVQNNVAANLKRIYKQSGNYKNALEFAEVYIATKDSMFNEEKTKALAEMQTKYETEKKQQEIEKQSLLIEKKEIENKRQRNQRNFFIAGSVLMTIMVLLVFKGYQQKKKSNQIITEKNALLIEANEEIHAQKDEIEAQHNMVIKQKDHIEIQKTKIEDSIRYARRIQKAVLPKENYADYLLGEHFVVFRPKDVVSGDFYWATMINEWLVVAVADCTGHGVPGAFMSMLGVSYLNEIARKKEVSDPAQVLKIMRETVIEALDQTSKNDSQKDGMDMSLLSINTKTNQCFWAGAGIPLWIIRKENKNKEFEDITSMVDVTKGDNMTLAISPIMNDFTCHKVELNKGDRIYLFSDGLVDQFGGPKGRKFMSKNLKTILAQTANGPINNQKQKIEEALDNWMNPPDSKSFGQIDDVTMIGMEF